MGDQTKGGIAWTDQTWNPVRGCSRVSKGCEHCYAETVASRFSGPGQPYEGLAKNGKWTGVVRMVSEHLADPLKWKKPRKIFVNSMSDLFHERLEDRDIAAIFGVMAKAEQHTFQVLTKRPKRMLEWFAWIKALGEDSDGETQPVNVEEGLVRKQAWMRYEKEVGQTVLGLGREREHNWPLPNVWLGVSVEDQRTADDRIPLLLQTPAAVRFVSYEPALSGVDFSSWLGYYPVHDETEDERRGRLSGGSQSRARDRLERPSVASSLPSRGSLESRRDQSRAGSPEKGGEQHGKLSPGPRDVGGPKVPCAGPSTGLAAHAWADSAGLDDQSQERRQGGQPAGESGVGDLLGAGSPRAGRPEGRSTRSGRREELDGETSSRSGSGDSAAAGGGGAPEFDCGELRGLGSDDLEDRPRRPVGLDLIIVGGESGPGARPFDIAWARSTIAQCKAAGVACFVKQLGSAAFEESDVGRSGPGHVWIGKNPSSLQRLRDRKGGDMEEWPEDLRVREFPR